MGICLDKCVQLETGAAQALSVRTEDGVVRNDNDGRKERKIKRETGKLLGNKHRPHLHEVLALRGQPA